MPRIIQYLKAFIKGRTEFIISFLMEFIEVMIMDAKNNENFVLIDPGQGCLRRKEENDKKQRYAQKRSVYRKRPDSQYHVKKSNTYLLV